MELFGIPFFGKALDTEILQRLKQLLPPGQLLELTKIRPHRFGGEGVLIGVQIATLNAQ